jgi:hypothetical protein
LHTPPIGQHPSLFIQEVIKVCEQAPFEQLSAVHNLLSLHSETEVQEVQPEIAVCEQTLFEHLSVVQALLSLH